MKQVIVWVTLSSLLASGAMAADRSVVLSTDQARNVLKQCSRNTPTQVDGTWPISKEVVADLERDLPKLSQRTKDESVDHPETYLRQYVGITIRGKKYVYVNAFSDSVVSLDRRHGESWKYEAIIVCDGGDGFWGALYDPESGQFSDLAFNGAI
jgi:hypothetical protein